jgi:poly(A) polymerase
MVPPAEPPFEKALLRETGAAVPAGPVGKIPPQPWMTAPETGMLIDALCAEGAEVRFIGGCVRDAVLKRQVRDIDVAVSEPPAKVMALLTKAGLKAVPTGIEHGTVTAVVEKAVFEITTLRVDVESYGRRARVAFTDDWKMDAARRDFTINALSCTPDGDIYDYFNGLDDLGRGRIRFVGNPGERIEEDRLRLLRFFRFYAYYGRPPPDSEALAACREQARSVTLLSGERVRIEIFRMLMAPDPADVFHLMRANGVLEHVLPEDGRIDRLRMLTWLDSRAIRYESVAPDPVRRLAALLETDAPGAEAIADRFRMSNEHRRRLAAMLDPSDPINPDMEPRQIRRALQRSGAAAVRDVALLNWAGELAAAGRLPHTRTEGWIALIEAADTWTPQRFPLRGRDVLALGVNPGRRVGAMLRAVETWWEEHDYRPDRAACLDRLRALLWSEAIEVPAERVPAKGLAAKRIPGSPE